MRRGPSDGWRANRRRRRVDGERVVVVVVVAVVVVMMLHACAPVAAFGPRPRPRLYEKPVPSRRLLEAELALRELGPGGPAAAGLLSDGHWLEGDVEEEEEEDDDGRRRGVDSVRFEEYALRGESRGGARASSASSGAAEDEEETYAGEIGGASASTTRAGIVPVDTMEMMDASTSRASEADARAVATKSRRERLDAAVEALLEERRRTSPSEEMFEMLRREGEKHVNPRTGKPFVWGDSWMHSRGGGIGTGRPESRPRRFTKDGAVEVMPAKGDAGYALVPMSSDKRGLLEFFDRCNGPRWSNLRNWGVGEPCANAWHGVACVGGRVTELLLNLNNVACMGSLNVTALADHVHELLYLDLSDNLFTGDLPDDLFRMTRLQSLVLSSNRITGTLSEKFGRLKELRHIDLSANGLHGPLPKSMGELSRLEVLYLGESGLENKNDFVGPIPETWTGLKSLRRLSLAGNENIGGTLPDWLLNNFDSLEELTLSKCGLRGEFPTNIDQLTSLRVLDLGENSLRGTLPVDSLSRLRHLKHLRLAGNALSGSLTSSIAGLREVEFFDASSNDFSGELPRELLGLPALELLDVSGNAFTGTLPAPSSTTNLRVLDADDNELTGAALDRAFFERAPHLRFLRLSRNRLRGTVPDDAFELATELVEFHAAHNDLSGPLPRSMGKMEKLASLRLNDNPRLGDAGGVPATLRDCASLVVVDLSRAGFRGDIPDGLFSRMPRLASVHLASNGFTGRVPPSLRDATMLRRLDLQRNAFSGAPPAWLVEMEHLERVDLTHNRLTGPIPSALYDAKTKSVPRLGEYGNRAAGAPRVMRLGGNPFFCPLPSWAKRVVGATCRHAEITSMAPTTGSPAGGDVITLDGRGFPASLPDVGCLFGTETEHLWVPAVERSETRVACVVPAASDLPKPPERQAVGLAVSVRVGTRDAGPTTALGELFVYL